MIQHRKVRDTHGLYTAEGAIDEPAVLKLAADLLETQLQRQDCFTSSRQTQEFLQMKLANREREVFAGLFLNAQHALIHYEELFLGTLDGASIWPREVLKTALQHNAAAVIFGHNHPSGHQKPSEADKLITQKLQDALEIVDIRVLDHVIVTRSKTCSMAEQGLL